MNLVPRFGTRHNLNGIGSRPPVKRSYPYIIRSFLHVIIYVHPIAIVRNEWSSRLFSENSPGLIKAHLHICQFALNHHANSNRVGCTEIDPPPIGGVPRPTNRVRDPFAGGRYCGLIPITIRSGVLFRVHKTARKDRKTKKPNSEPYHLAPFLSPAPTY